jgi:hypothetical protein
MTLLDLAKANKKRHPKNRRMIIILLKNAKKNATR